jgi:hypothetical protein
MEITFLFCGLLELERTSVPGGSRSLCLQCSFRVSQLQEVD